MSRSDKTKQTKQTDIKTILTRAQTGRSMSQSTNTEGNPPGDLDMNNDAVASVGAQTSANTEETLTITAIKQLLSDFHETTVRKDLIDAIECAVKPLFENIDKMRNEVNEVNLKVNDIEVSQEFQDRQISDLQGKLEESVKKNSVLEETLNNALDWMHYNEWRSRKYNLIIYGVRARKDIMSTLNDFFVKELEIDPDRADKIVIANAHILPVRHSDSFSNKLGASENKPPPVIIKFVRLVDRDLVLSRGPRLKGKQMRIVTDLPADLKQLRHRLLRVAFDMRKEGKVTRLRERGPNVFLEFKNSTGDTSWSRYEA